MNLKNNSNSDLNKSVSVKKSRFTEMLIEENELDQNGFKNWIFCNGMLFNSPDKWWGDHGLRDYPHEGVDYVFTVTVPTIYAALMKKPESL
jgi:hypothetical protein